MINNNRQAGRRRGRGGQRQGGGNQGNGSRIDNRARGNAAQLLEKYKNLAAEAQRQGDRVNTEYYLQFADHYFRVVSEQRGRFEEQDRQRRETQGQFDDEDGFDDGDEADIRDSQSQPQSHPQSHQRQPRRAEGERDGNREPRENNREGRNGRTRRDRDDRPAELPEGAAFASEGEPAAGPTIADEQEERPRRTRAPRRPAATTTENGADNGSDTLDIDRLPPSFAPANDGEGADGEAEAKPRRRRLRPAAGEASSAG